jgi:energy coupling factor transporter S component ThiW
MIAKTGTLCYFKREYNMEVPYMLDIFDILGPVMVGPSSSHTAGAVRIGRMARVLLGEEPIKAEIGLYGSFAETGQGHGTNRALIAGLLYKYTGKLPAAYAGEIFGTGIVGGMLSYPIARLVMGNGQAALFTFVVPFLISTVAGTILGAVITMSLHRTGYLSRVQDEL